MALRTFVKVSGVNNLSDARYCAGMGVDVMGFDLNPESSGYVSPEVYSEITNWISGVEYVAEFNNCSIEVIINQIRHYKVHYLQVTDTYLIHKLKPLGIPVILRFEASRIASTEVLEAVMEEFKNDVAFFSIEADTIIIDNSLIDQLEKIAQKLPIVLGFGITENNIGNLIDNFSFKGIGLRGGEEIKPGYKDFDELAGILETIEIDG